MTLDEARAMFEAARRHGVMLLEAYPWWFQPQTAALLGLLHGGAIGTVRQVQASFGFMLRDPAGSNIRSIAALGGGALMDAGCYGLSLIRLAIDRAPQSVQASARMGRTGVDIAHPGHAALCRWRDGAAVVRDGRGAATGRRRSSAATA